MISRRIAVLAATVLGVIALGGTNSHAQKKYGQGVTDTEILMGQTVPYTGPLASVGINNGGAAVAAVKLLNDRGGVNGRKLRLLSLDDGYLPPKTLELTRKMVEQDRVAFIYGSLGTGPLSAIAPYLTERKMPHIMFQAGTDKFYTREFPVMVPYLPRYGYMAALFAKWLQTEKPNAKIAFLYQNDDFGLNFLDGLKAALGANAANVVKSASFEVRDPSVDSQVISLAETKADVLFLASVPGRPVSQAIRKATDLGWKPTFMIPLTTNDPQTVLQPAGLENAVGAISSAMLKDPNDPDVQNDPDVKEWHAWMDAYAPQADKRNLGWRYEYVKIFILKAILERAADDLTQENILKVATSMPKAAYPLFIPGVTIEGTPEFLTQRILRFDGKRWVGVGTPITVGN